MGEVRGKPGESLQVRGSPLGSQLLLGSWGRGWKAQLQICTGSRTGGSGESKAGSTGRQSAGNASRDRCPLQAGLRSFLLKDAGPTWRSAGALTSGNGLVLFSSCKCYCRPLRHLRTYQPFCTTPVPSNSSFPGHVPPPRVPSLPNRWELSHLVDILPSKVEGRGSRPLPLPST